MIDKELQGFMVHVSTWTCTEQDANVCSQISVLRCTGSNVGKGVNQAKHGDSSRLCNTTWERCHSTDLSKAIGDSHLF